MAAQANRLGVFLHAHVERSRAELWPQKTDSRDTLDALLGADGPARDIRCAGAARLRDSMGTVTSGRNFTTKEKLIEESKPRSCWSKASLHQALRTSPMTPPQTASKNPSHNNCLMICQRDAPTDSLNTISFALDLLSASSMFSRL